MPGLDSRLLLAASLVLPGLPAADIGTDHNHLPVHLIKEGICPKVIASDRAIGPYSNAQRFAKRQSLQNHIDVRLGEGLEVLKPGEAATIIIAGMGGRLICEILQNTPVVLEQTQRLVLQPQRDAPALRRWLMENGWNIIEERLALEQNIYYLVLAAEQGSMSLDEQQLLFGPCLMQGADPLFIPFLRFRQQEIDQLVSEVKSGKSDDALLREEQLSLEMARVKSLLDTLTHVPN